ncbi:HD domain-containing protein [Labilibacter marinus]|uniref:HD domain-containing protein n=1 Tax=Labilibacter marinus TaxID=1477105 RepID=UPI0008312157|nr:HD domain-containing protein [Labilibacter marinus]
MPKNLNFLASRFQQQLSFITEIDQLKQIIRQTLLLDSSKQENDAEHSWHMAVSIIILAEYANEKELDILKCVKMALIHDVVEIDAGDTYAYDEMAHQDKEEREQKAAQRIFGLLPPDLNKEYTDLWYEFEKGETKEAKYTGAVDRYMPVLHNYKTQGKQWVKHNISADMVLKRNKPIEEGSAFLWNEVKQMVAKAQSKGFLR